MLFFSPESDAEFEEYFHCRWLHLRAPQGMPHGSERDGLEDVSAHYGLRGDDGSLAGFGKLVPVDDGVLRVSHVAIAEEHRGKSVGRRMMNFLETEAVRLGARTPILNARETATGFYLRLGYSLVAELPSQISGLKLYKMEKSLDATDNETVDWDAKSMPVI